MTDTTPEHTIAALCERSHKISEAAGWNAKVRPYHTGMILIQSELSEALEDYRNNHKLDEIWYERTIVDAGGVKYTDVLSLEEVKLLDELSRRHCKPCGIPSELADIVIRVCQECGTNGVGQQLATIYMELDDVPMYETFEEFIAEVTVSVSLSYARSKTEGASSIYRLSHLADALAEIFTFCAGNGIDLWAAIDEKEAYNRTRAFRHGGKKV